jgi:hypothetical protein
MKNRLVLVAMLVICSGAQAAWGQWSSDPSRNLPLADKINNDQVQPKVKPLPNDQWYVSWFGADPNSPPPIGYDVYVQRLSRGGVERFRHDGRLVADLSNSSTEDYGLDVDSEGNALLAFLDTREGSNPQVTAAKIAAQGKSLWGQRGVQLTSGSSFHAAPKIAGTRDGGAVVAWTNDSSVVLQKLDRHGHPLWGKGVVFSESGYNYSLGRPARGGRREHDCFLGKGQRVRQIKRDLVVGFVVPRLRHRCRLAAGPPVRWPSVRRASSKASFS